MSDQNNQVPFLKKDSLVPIEIGAGFVQRLSLVATNLCKGKTKEELDQLEKLNSEKPDAIPEWAADAATVYTLLKVIYKKADELGMVEYKDITEVLSQPGSSSAGPVQ